MSELRAGSVEVGGVRSPTIEAGPEGAPEAAVFVHGNPGSLGDWRALVAAAGARGRRAVALDMPGFGKADKPEGFAYTVPGYAAHLHGALAALGVARAHLVLHDFGGAWGLAWAAAHPAMVASVALINVGVLPGYRWHWMARVWRTPLLGELAMSGGTLAIFARALRVPGARPLPDAFVREMWDHYDAGTRRAVLRLYRATPEQSFAGADALRPLIGDRPALVVWGARDPYVSAAYAERQRELFRGASIHTLPESGHWPHADSPGEVAALLVPFLSAGAGQG